jgi:hypothetical protein
MEFSSGRSERRYNWVLDTHLHLYHGYDLGVFLRTLARRVKDVPDVAPDAIMGGVIADTDRCRGWEMVRDGAFPGVREFSVTQVDGEALLVDVDGVMLHLFRGCQVVTHERVEVLGVVPRAEVAAGQALKATLDEIVSLGGIPVLPWSPGKWWGRRGKLVRDAYRNYPEVWAGDIPMRWWGRTLDLGWGPGARRCQRVVRGSDPLPIHGDEARAGSYMTGLMLDDSHFMLKSDISRALFKTLRSASGNATPLGRPDSFITSSRRWLALRYGKQPNG